MSDLQPGSMRLLDSRFSRSLGGALLLAACFACGGGAGTSDAVTPLVAVTSPVLTGAVLWSSSGESSVLGWLPGDIYAAANAVSRDGSVVVGYSTEPSSHLRPFRWTRQTGMTAIAAPTDAFSDVIATAVSGDGGVIVGWRNTANGETAVIWDQSHGMRRLEDMLKIEYQTSTAAGMFSRVTGISDDGRTIVGFGINPNGHTEGWVLKFPD